MNDMFSSIFKYQLAIVAVMKNEAPYVKVDYHLLAGVDHFYIYDNDSEDNLKDVLQPYIDKEIVTYEQCPGKAAQLYVYNKAIQQYKFDCQYIAFIDADEFIFPKKNNINNEQNRTEQNRTEQNRIQYNTIQYNTIQYNTIQYNTFSMRYLMINLLQVVLQLIGKHSDQAAMKKQI